MPGIISHTDHLQGLTTGEIPALQRQYGKNILHSGAHNHFTAIIKNIVLEPMFLLLLAASSLYFILGETSEGFLMLAAITCVTFISLYQEVKSTNAVKALQQLTEAMVTVIRDGKENIISAEELVPGDILLLEEGMNVPADAVVIQQNDFSVNESAITGESVPVDKDVTKDNNKLYHGTTINSGQCIAEVTSTGDHTVLGKLGKAVGTYQSSRTLLQSQMHRFLSFFGLFGLAGFLTIFFLNYFQGQEWTTSLLLALTLAMSAIPEEIPVAFSSFMALGAYKMSKLGIISRQPQVIESLGAVSVCCFDKTGTLTENRMELRSVYDLKNDELIELNDQVQLADHDLLYYAALASEAHPFDAMEKAIWHTYQQQKDAIAPDDLKMIFEYPLEGRPPMMTHVYEKEELHIVAAKGAAERILSVCKPGKKDREKIEGHVHELAKKGYRILGVASAVHTGSKMPAHQDDFNWKFEGILALYDPPKKNTGTLLDQFHEAGIKVKMITGDHRETAMNIAGQVGIPRFDQCMNGDEVMAMTATELKMAVMNTNVFARMFPDAKLKVIEALKANDEIVAMTGDGVNDGPALKAANIGIAMGLNGTAIARQAADLVLTDDNLERLVTAVREGRKIFSNLKKAIRYIISIHIPIILVASLPLLLGWIYPTVFTPVHIIFLELIMGPTCSIFFEREPVEETIMQQPPRKRNKGLFSKGEFLTSALQGIVIATGILILYFCFMHNGAGIEKTRTIVFITLVLSNIFLTFEDRSFTKTIVHTSHEKNNLVPFILIVSVIFLTAMLYIPGVRSIFGLTKISNAEFFLCLGVSFISVLWFELYKTGLFKNK